MAVVKVALRQRETLALLRVRENAIVLQTMLWPDEVREAEFPVLDNDVEVRPQEMAMASSLIDSLSGEFEVDQFEDEYRKAVGELIEYKREHGGGRPAPQEAPAEDTDDMTDLLTALRRSVEAAGGKAETKPEKAADAPAPEEKDEEPDDMTDLLTALRRSVEAAGGKAADTSSSKKSESEDTPAPEEKDEEPAPKKSTRKRSTAKSADKAGDKAEDEPASGTKKATTTRSRKKKTDEAEEKAS
jgi:DNA end-binding protein Ku